MGALKYHPETNRGSEVSLSENKQVKNVQSPCAGFTIEMFV